MNSSKKIKGTVITGHDDFGSATAANHISTFDLSYISMGYIDTSVSTPSAVGDAHCYLVSQFEASDGEFNFGASTQNEAIEDLETVLTAFSENGKSLKQTASVLELDDEELNLNGFVQYVSYISS